jgi:hypothetical protein
VITTGKIEKAIKLNISPKKISTIVDEYRMRLNKNLEKKGVYSIIFIQ